MAIVSHKHRIAFFPMPKNCSTSFKHMFYELETGFPFRKARRRFDLVGHVHKYYPTLSREKWLAIYSAYESITIIRDPIKRFLSAYSNRVVHIKALETVGKSAELIEDSPHPLQPTLEEFVQNLEFYCEVSPYIRDHVAPQKTVIGHFFPKIKHVYDTSQVSKMEALLSERTGMKIVLPREQSGGEKLTLDNLSPQALKKLLAFYAEDYKMLSQFYIPPD